MLDGPALAGTGGAIRRALPRLGQAFFVMYGDSYLECDFAAIEAAFQRSGSMGLMTVYRNDDRWDRSNVEYEDGRILRYDKIRRDAHDAAHRLRAGDSDARRPLRRGRRAASRSIWRGCIRI